MTNSLDETKEVVWEGTYGTGYVEGAGFCENLKYFPMCPYCNEYAYEDDKCVFCKKPYKLDWSKRPAPKVLSMEKEWIKDELQPK